MEYPPFMNGFPSYKPAFIEDVPLPEGNLGFFPGCELFRGSKTVHVGEGLLVIHRGWQNWPLVWLDLPIDLSQNVATSKYSPVGQSQIWCCRFYTPWISTISRFVAAATIPLLADKSMCWIVSFELKSLLCVLKWFSLVVIIKLLLSPSLYLPILVCFLQFGPHYPHPVPGSDIPTISIPRSQVSTIILNRVELLAKNILKALQEIAPSSTMFHRSKDMTRS